MDGIAAKLVRCRSAGEALWRRELLKPRPHLPDQLAAISQTSNITNRTTNQINNQKTINQTNINIEKHGNRRNNNHEAQAYKQQRTSKQYLVSVDNCFFVVSPHLQRGKKKTGLPSSTYIDLIFPHQEREQLMTKGCKNRNEKHVPSKLPENFRMFARAIPEPSAKTTKFFL